MPDGIVTPLTLADGLVAAVQAFAADLAGVPINVSRIYHDASKPTDAAIKVSIIPLSVRKSGEGKNVRYDCDLVVVIQNAVPKREKAKLDALVNYATNLDVYLESVDLGIATYQVAETDVAVWAPDDLHERNEFTRVLPISYFWKRRRGNH